MKSIVLEKDMKSVWTLWQRGGVPKLFPVSPHRVLSLFENGILEHNKKCVSELKKRLPRDNYFDTVNSIRLLLHYGDFVFPGFRCVYGEFVTEEWLGLVDYHKDFHRDHVVHQAQVGLVVKRLLTELVFDESHPLFPAYWCCRRSAAGVPAAQASLLDLAAHVLARGGPDVQYLYDFADELGIPRGRIEPCTPRSFWFWRGVIYDAAIIAGLFHDIGYPLSFLRTVSSKVEDGGFRGLLLGADAEAILDLFDDPLCLMPFRGYRSGRRRSLSHTLQPGLEKTMATALSHSHGLPGALTFLHLNHKVMDPARMTDSLRGRLVMEVAALAMTMHDMPKLYWPRSGKQKQPTPAWPYMRVAFDRDPVSFILTLADELQCYGRFNAIFELNVDDNPVLTCEQVVQYVRLEHEKDNLTITFAFRRKNWKARLYTEKDNDELMVSHFDPRRGYLDYTSLFNGIRLQTEWVH